MNVWVMKLKAKTTVKPERRKNKETVFITKMNNIYYLQERHCMYNAALRRVQATIVAVEKQ